jgi:ATP/maltotriose-dependent transcriptional regulator MalT
VRGLEPAADEREQERIELPESAETALRLVAGNLGLAAGARSAAALAAELRPEWARSRLYEAVLDLLRRLGDERPVVLAIEDLHWADDSTRELLAFLIRNAQAGEQLLLIVTFRSDELHRRHPLLFWLAEIDRLPGVERIELARLGRSDVIRQMTAILGREPAPALIDAIFDRSDGNPFFAEELLAAGTEARRLPPTLREVLAARLAHVSDATLRVLGVAAVAGRQVEHDLLAAVAGLSDRDLFEALHEATASQLLVAEDDHVSERYAFRHALIGEAAAETVLPGQRRRLHVAIAEAMEAATAPGSARDAGRLAEIAHHWSEARELARAFGASIRAGAAAMRSGAYAEGLRQYDRALELWDVVNEAADLLASELTGTDGQDAATDRADLMRLAARAAQLAGVFDRAINLLREALTIVDPVADPVRAGVLSERLGRAYWTSGEIDLSLAAYRRAVDLVPAEPPGADRARVLAGLAQVLMLSARYRESTVLAREAHEIAQTVGDRQIQGHALCTIGVDLAYTGDMDKGIELLREALAIAEEVRDFDDLGRGYACLSTSLDVAGRLEESWRVSMDGVRRLREAGMGATYGAFLMMNAAEAHTELGRWDASLEAAEEALPITSGMARVLALQVLARLRIGRGEFDAAGRALDEAARTLGDGVDAQMNGPLATARMELASWTGDLAAGRAAADDAIALLAGIEDPLTLARVLAAAVRIEADIADRARAARDKAGAGEARKRADDILGRLETLSGDELGPALRAMVAIPRALAIAEASRAAGASDPAAWTVAARAASTRPAPYQVAYARFREAEALLATRADRQLVAHTLSEARRIADGLDARPLRDAVEAMAARGRIELADLHDGGPMDAADGAATPVVVDGLAGYGLTAREREVLRLVASGRTNRQIADELFISESTAGVHVSHILGKLEVASRVEAATIAARLGLAGQPIVPER